MEKERIDNLGINGYQIIQKEQGFCFGMDAVLLSDFAQVKNGGRVLDQKFYASCQKMDWSLKEFVLCIHISIKNRIYFC